MSPYLCANLQNLDLNNIDITNIAVVLFQSTENVPDVLGSVQWIDARINYDKAALQLVQFAGGSKVEFGALPIKGDKAIEIVDALYVLRTSFYFYPILPFPVALLFHFIGNENRQENLTIKALLLTLWIFYHTIPPIFLTRSLKREVTAEFGLITYLLSNIFIILGWLPLTNIPFPLIANIALVGLLPILNTLMLFFVYDIRSNELNAWRVQKQFEWKLFSLFMLISILTVLIIYSIQSVIII